VKVSASIADFEVSSETASDVGEHQVDFTYTLTRYPTI